MSKTRKEILLEVICKLVEEARFYAGDLAIDCLSKDPNLQEIARGHEAIGRFKGLKEAYQHLCNHLTGVEMWTQKEKEIVDE